MSQNGYPSGGPNFLPTFMQQGSGSVSIACTSKTNDCHVVY